MPRRRPHRPPPDGPPRRRRWWHRDRTGTGHASGGGAAYESSEAAAQERLITEALTDLRDMDVREVMTPRVDVVALSIPVHAEEVAQAVRESGHRCFPVVNGGLDDVVGVLYVNDLFRSRRTALRVGEGTGPTRPGEALLAGTGEGVSPIDISRRIRPAYVVPESRRILDALVEIRRQRRGFAVVVDEHGGVSGVLTVKDLLEPIVGELHDEFDTDEEPAIVRVDASRWLVDGRVNVDEVRERLGIDLPEGDYVTLGGYLFDGFGRIPEEGESLTVDGWELTVQEMEKRRVAQVVVRQRSDGDVADGSDDARSDAELGRPPDGRPAELPTEPSGPASAGPTASDPAADRPHPGGSAGEAPGEVEGRRPGSGPATDRTSEARLAVERVQTGASTPSGTARRRG